MKIVINSIDYSGSIVDGPGLRTVLFVQGCNRRCEECHNPSTWNIEGGIGLDVEEIVQELNEKCINKKITISGGEPLLQFPAVLKLVKNLEDFNVVLYTGFELEYIPKEILKYINYIKVGRYIKKKKTKILPFIGYRNQKFIKLRGEQSEINKL